MGRHPRRRAYRVEFLCEEARRQFGGFDSTAGATLGFAILSDIEAFFFINAAQGDRRSNILQAPKVTLFNGQMASVFDHPAFGRKGYGAIHAKIWTADPGRSR